MSGYIIGNLRVCEQAESARPVCNNGIENSFLIVRVYNISARPVCNNGIENSFLIVRVYVRLLIRISFFLFRAECLYQFSDNFDSLYVHIRLWLLFVDLFLLVYL